jgi:hypothetical protein
MRQLFRATCPCKIFMSLLQALIALGSHSDGPFADWPVFPSSLCPVTVDSLAQWQVGHCLRPEFLGPYTMNSCLNERFAFAMMLVSPDNLYFLLFFSRENPC